MKINGHKAHKKLWGWLAENPTKEKEDWPQWEPNGGNIPNIFFLCFACSIGYGDICPLTNIECAPSKPGMYCFSEFHRWTNAITPKSRRKYAKLIAEMPWHGKKMIDV